MSEIFSKYDKYNKSGDPKKLKELMKFIQSKKKDEIEKKYKDGYTILTLACNDGRSEIVKFLLKECGTNPNSRDINLNASIHYAASQGFQDIIKLLVDSGAGVNIKNGRKETPLILAVKNDKPATVILLLTLGADKNIGIKKPLDIAREKGDTRMINPLEGNYSKESKDAPEDFEYGDIKNRLSNVSERLQKVEEREQTTLDRVDSIENDVVVVKKRVNSMEGVVTMLAHVSSDLKDEHSQLAKFTREHSEFVKTLALDRDSYTPYYSGNRYVPDPTVIQNRTVIQPQDNISDEQNPGKKASFYVEGQEGTEEPRLRNFPGNPVRVRTEHLPLTDTYDYAAYKSDSEIYESQLNLDMIPPTDMHDQYLTINVNGNYSGAKAKKTRGSNDDGFAVEVKLKFCAQTDDDLTIRPGDIITHVLQREDGWWEGNLGNSRGRFPSNFVKVTSNSAAILASRANTNKTRAREPLPGTGKPIDTIRNRFKNFLLRNTVKLEHIADVDPDYDDGEFNMFNSDDGGNYESQLNEDMIPPTASHYEVQFQYSAKNDDELTLTPGDVITHVSHSETGWWEGNLGKERGVFPSNFVKQTSNSAAILASTANTNKTRAKEPLPETTPNTGDMTDIDIYEELPHDDPPPNDIYEKPIETARYEEQDYTVVRQEATNQADIEDNPGWGTPNRAVAWQEVSSASCKQEEPNAAAIDIIPEKSRIKLKRNLVLLSRNVRLQQMYPTFYAEGLITDHQMHQIKTGCDEEKMAFHIFENLQRSSRSSLRRMKDVLKREQQPHVAELIPDC